MILTGPPATTAMDQAVESLLRWTPGGSQTGSKAPGKAGPSGGGYPAVLDSGTGAWVYDINGHAYIDWIASLAAVGLGHAHREVTRAVERTLRAGNLLSLPTRAEAQASEELCEFLRWPEQVRWVKTGSEATEAAVRIARCATGRSLILTIRAGYHAWHAWFQAVKPEHPGVPDGFEDVIIGTTYGDQDSVGRILATQQVACVILEGAPITGGGSKDWLTWLRGACTNTDTVLIFDEVVWGLRLARGGAGDYFGVTPDLATFGKALGNGIPVACVVGKPDLMQHATLISGTFGGDRMGLEAARAVLRVHEDQPVVETLWERGTQLMEGVNGLQGPICLTGYAPHPVPTVLVPEGYLTRPEAILSLFLQHLAERGVLWHPSGINVMAAHTRQHVDTTVDASAIAMRAVGLALENGTVEAALNGTPYVTAFARRS